MDSTPRVDVAVKYHILAFNVVVFTELHPQQHGKRISLDAVQRAREYIALFAVPTTRSELDNHPSYRAEMQNLYRTTPRAWFQHFDVFARVWALGAQDDIDRLLFMPCNHDVRDEVDKIDIPARQASPQISLQTAHTRPHMDNRTLSDRLRPCLRELIDVSSPVFRAVDFVHDFLIEIAIWVLPRLLQMIRDVPVVVGEVIAPGSRARQIILELVPQLQAVPAWLLDLRIPAALGGVPRSILELLLSLASFVERHLPAPS